MSAPVKLALVGLGAVAPPVCAGVAEGRADIVICQRIAACLTQRRGIPYGGEAE